MRRPQHWVWAAMAAVVIGSPALAADGQRLPAPAGTVEESASRPLDLKQPAFDWSAPAPPVDGPGTDTLGEFTTLALSMHPTIRGAVAAVDSARGEAIQARLYPNPSLASGSPQANGAYSQWNVFVTQDVVTAGKLRLQQQAALRQVDARGFELVRARFDVLTGTRRSFYGLLVAQRRREILRRLFDVTERSVTVAERLLAGGEGTRSDLLFFKIARDQAAIRLRNADVYVEAGRRELAAAVGQPELDVGTVQGDLTADLPDFDLAQLQRDVVALNAKPRAAQAAVSRARWLLERARVQPVPDVNVLGGYQAQVDFPPQPQGLMQLMIEVPLFDRNQGNVRAARANIATAQAERRQIELELATLTAEALAGYRTGGQLAEKYESDILPEARENLSLSQRLYAAGVVSFLNLVEAQRILIDAELGYVDALEQRWRHAVAIADLLQADAFPFTMAAVAPVRPAPAEAAPAAGAPAGAAPAGPMPPAPAPAPVPLPPVAPEPAAG